jgi:hypothetical protein
LWFGAMWVLLAPFDVVVFEMARNYLKWLRAA